MDLDGWIWKSQIIPLHEIIFQMITDTPLWASHETVIYFKTFFIKPVCL